MEKENKKNKNLKFIIIAFIIICLGASFLYVCIEKPDTLPGFLLYKAVINLSPNKESTFRLINRALEDSGSYIPPELDIYLCDKIKNSQNEKLKVAIINFYARQPSSRKGMIIYTLPVEDKKFIIGTVISNFKTYSDSEVHNAVLLIESLRIGANNYKASLIPIGMKYGKYKDMSYSEWWSKEGRATAEKSIIDWYNRDDDWDRKSIINPFENYGLEIVSP